MLTKEELLETLEDILEITEDQGLDANEAIDKIVELAEEALGIESEHKE